MYNENPNKGITPAYAGNTVELWEKGNATEDHPRLRGEHVLSSKGTGEQLGSPPPTRGTPPPVIATPAACGITPAYAGNTFSKHLFARVNQDHPRLRGEHSTLKSSKM